MTNHMQADYEHVTTGPVLMLKCKWFLQMKHYTISMFLVSSVQNNLLVKMCKAYMAYMENLLYVVLYVGHFGKHISISSPY